MSLPFCSDSCRSHAVSMSGKLSSDANAANDGCYEGEGGDEQHNVQRRFEFTTLEEACGHSGAPALGGVTKSGCVGQTQICHLLPPLFHDWLHEVDVIEGCHLTRDMTFHARRLDEKIHLHTARNEELAEDAAYPEEGPFNSAIIEGSTHRLTLHGRPVFVR